MKVSLFRVSIRICRLYEKTCNLMQNLMGAAIRGEGLVAITISRAAGRSIPGHGNIVNKKITNSISDAVDALATFLEFSRTLDTQIVGIFSLILKIRDFHLDQLAQKSGLSLKF